MDLVVKHAATTIEGLRRPKQPADALVPGSTGRARPEISRSAREVRRSAPVRNDPSAQHGFSSFSNLLDRSLLTLLS